MEDDLTSGPLDERLQSKNWRVRLAAYEELKKKYTDAEEDNAHVFLDFDGYLKKIVGDSNAAAQAEGLEAVYIFVSRATHAARLASSLAGLLIDKGLGAQRVATKQKAIDILLMFIERENPDDVLAALVPGCSHKQPKIAATSIYVLKEAVRLFGVKPLGGQMKAVLAAVPDFFGHADPNVRAEANALASEMFRYLGGTLRQKLNDLRPAQLKELDDAFKTITPGQARPERYLRSQVPKTAPVARAAGGARGSAAAADAEEDEAASGAVEIDPYELLDPVDILPQVTAETYDLLTSGKWSEKRNQLDTLIQLASAPKLKGGDFGELAKVLRKLLGDNNVIVTGKAAKLLALLAKGLRKDFAFHAKAAVSALLDRLKEKKQQVTDPINEALDCMYGNCFMLSEVMEDITAASDNKVPKVRADTASWIARCLQSKFSRTPSANQLVKPIANILLKLIDDGTPEVRDAAAVCFGALAGLVGERPLQPYLAKLDPIKEKKVREQFTEAASAAQDLTASTKGKEPAKKSGYAPPPSSSTLPSLNKKAAPKGIMKKSSSSSSLSSSAKAPAANNKAPPPVDEEFDPNAGGITPEEALDKAREFLDERILAGLEDKAWKGRLEALDSLGKWAESMGSALTAPQEEVVIRVLQLRPGWKDVNVQVLIRMYELVGRIAKSATAFSKRSAAWVIPGLVEKIADVKVKPVSHAVLTIFAEVISPAFVLSQLAKCALAHKNPKVTSEVLEWLVKATEEFGLAAYPVKALLDAASSSLESPNPAVKASAVKLLATMRKDIPSLKDHLTGVKPALMQTIDAEFAKVANMKSPAPTRTYRLAAPAKGGALRSSGKGVSAALDDLPREDISPQITSKFLADLNDKNWKVRKEQLDLLQNIITDAHKRILAKGLSELFHAMKARCTENNQKLQQQALELCALLATSIGAGVAPLAKIVLPAIVELVGDSKKGTHEAAYAAVEAIAAEVPLDTLVPFFATALCEKETCRRDVLLLCFKLASAPSNAKTDLKPLVKSVIAAHQDRLKEVRDAADVMTGEIIRHGGLNEFRKALKDLKPTQASSINLIIERIAREVKSADPTPVSREEVVQEVAEPVRAPAPAPVPEKKRTPRATEEVPPPAAIAPVSAVPKATARSNSASRLPAPKAAVEPQAGILKQAEPSRDKEWRAKADVRTKWGSWEVPTKEIIQIAKDEMAAIVPPALHTKLFSTDTQQLVDSFTELSRLLKSLPASIIIAHLDCLLKWSTLQLWDASSLTPGHLALDLLIDLLQIALREKYLMSDYEGSVVAPHLLRRYAASSGEAKLKVNAIVKSFMRTYPPSRLFKVALDMLGDASRSAPLRFTCVETLVFLLKRQGKTVCNGQQILQVAGYLNDQAVQRVVLTFLGVAANYFQDEFWRIVTPLGTSQVAALRANLPEVKELTVSLEDDTPLTRTLSQPAVAPSTAPVDADAQIAHWAAVLSGSANYEGWIDALKTIHLTLGGESDAYKNFTGTGRLDPLIEQLALKLKTASTEDDRSTRLCKYVINALVELFKRVPLAASVSMERLQPLMEGVLTRLVDECISQDFVRAFNTLMLKMLENSPPTASNCILIRLLASTTLQPKCVELVMKCLLKLTKALPSALELIQIEIVLKEIHVFMISPRGPVKQPDLALRTVRTILHELVRLKGSAILAHTNLIPNPMPDSPPLILQLINQLLGAQKEAPSPARTAAAPATSTADAHRATLQEIFKRIGSQATTTQGLAELFAFKRSHPEVDIEPFLKMTSQHFQQYIVRGLSKLEEKAASENTDPNDSALSAYQERLRAHKELYGAGSVLGAKDNYAPVTTVSLDDIRQRLQGTKIRTTAPEPLPEAPVVQTNISDLQERLARLKREKSGL